MNETQKNYDVIRIHFDTRTESGLGYIAHAVENSDGIKLYIGREFPRTENLHGEIAVKIVDICMSIASEHPKSSVEALVYPASPRKDILAIGSQFGNVRFALRSELDKDSVGGTIVSQDGAAWLSKIAPQVVEDHNKLNFVATDGSLNKFIKGGSGAYGWISSTGEFGYGSVNSSESSLICELFAIKEMLTSLKQKKNIRILVDNRLAIKISRDPNSMDHTNMVSKRAKKLAREINELLSGRQNVEIRWVKSHNGHPLNEGADRLARNSRLGEDFDQDSTTLRAIAQTIADDTVEEYLGYTEGIQ